MGWDWALNTCAFPNPQDSERFPRSGIPFDSLSEELPLPEINVAAILFESLSMVSIPFYSVSRQICTTPT